MECLIWSLRLFNDEVLFSGESSGELCIWDAEHGTLTKQFSNLKADISCIEANHKNLIVYATGVDARILSVQLNKANNQWVFLSLFRGQSHDVNSLILSHPNELLSAGRALATVTALHHEEVVAQGKRKVKSKRSDWPCFARPSKYDPFKSSATLAPSEVVNST